MAFAVFSLWRSLIYFTHSRKESKRTLTLDKDPKYCEERVAQILQVNHITKWKIHSMTRGTRLSFVSSCPHYLLLLWTGNFIDRGDDKYTWGLHSYLTHKSFSLFNYTRDVCNLHDWTLLGLSGKDKCPWIFIFFSLWSDWNYLQKLIILHNLKILYFVVPLFFFFFHVSDFHFGRIGHSNFNWDKFLGLIMILQVLYSNWTIVFVS